MSLSLFKKKADPPAVKKPAEPQASAAISSPFAYIEQQIKKK